MPYPAKIVSNFQKEYGSKWKNRFFAWKNANPEQFSKALSTTRHKNEKVIEHTGYKKRLGKKKYDGRNYAMRRLGLKKRMMPI